MSRKPVVRINGELLRQKLEALPIDKKVISTALGKGSTYLQDSCNRNCIARDSLELLKTLYGITCLEIEEEKEEPAPDQNAAIDYERLGEVIETALFYVMSDFERKLFKKLDEITSLPVYEADIDKVHKKEEAKEEPKIFSPFEI